VAAVAEKLRDRPGSIGVVSGLGWYLTKHSIGVYSTAAPRVPWKRNDPGEIQRAIDAEPHPEVVARPAGRSTIETYTVTHGRDGAPERGIVIGRLDDGRRFIANTPADRALLEHMEADEAIGAPGSVEPAGDDTNLWRPS
jgi:acetyl-CoA C-acetyltransferase